MLGKPKKGQKQTFGPKGELNRIAELLSEWWKQADNGQQGYSYRTVVTIGNLPVTALLDGGSGINSVTQEMLVGVLNRAWADGVPTDSLLWPVVQLEKWPEADNVMGIAAGTPLRLLGSAVLRVHFSDIDARAPGAEVLVRCRIFPKGSTDWHGLIIGAEARDCKERGGLGHRVTERAHILEGIGVRCPRTERLNSGRTDESYRVQQTAVSFALPVQTFVSPSSDEEGEAQRVHLCARLDVSGSGTHRCNAKSIVLPAISSKLYYCGGEPIVLEPGDGAWIPVKSPNEYNCSAGSVMTVQKFKYVDDGPEDHLDVVPGLT